MTTSLPCDTLPAWQNLHWDAVWALYWRQSAAHAIHTRTVRSTRRHDGCAASCAGQP
ncbi:MAG: hypothetical protein WDN00_13605 [Limisphaerales bacterium]